jgi:hypothetical protein
MDEIWMRYGLDIDQIWIRYGLIHIIRYGSEIFIRYLSDIDRLTFRL